MNGKPFNTFSLYRQAALLDACFLLALVDENDFRSKLSDQTINLLEQQGWEIYTSTHVHSEVINRLMHGLFEVDVAFYVTAQEVFNNYIGLLVDQFFDTQEKLDIIDWLTDPDREEEPCPVNLRRKFAYIYKSEYRDYLMPYIYEANDIFDSCMVRYNIKFIPSGTAEYYIAVKNMNEQKLLSQDAYHMSVCEANDIPHIITYDHDFISTRTVNVFRPDLGAMQTTGA